MLQLPIRRELRAQPANQAAPSARSVAAAVSHGGPGGPLQYRPLSVSTSHLIRDMLQATTAGGVTPNSTAQAPVAQAIIQGPRPGSPPLLTKLAPPIGHDAPSPSGRTDFFPFSHPFFPLCPGFSLSLFCLSLLVIFARVCGLHLSCSDWPAELDPFPFPPRTLQTLASLPPSLFSPRLVSRTHPSHPSSFLFQSHPSSVGPFQSQGTRRLRDKWQVSLSSLSATGPATSPYLSPPITTCLCPLSPNRQFWFRRAQQQLRGQSTTRDHDDDDTAC